MVFWVCGNMPGHCLALFSIVVDDYPYEADDEESKEEAEFRVRLAYGPRVIVTRRSLNASTQVQERQAARAASRAPHRARGE